MKRVMLLRASALLLATFALASCGSSSSPEDPVVAAANPPPSEEAPPAPPAAEAAAPPAADPPAPPPVPIDPNALPVITPGEGITVESLTRVSARTFDIKVSTPNISPNAKMKGGNGVRITLPPNYPTSGKRYPVLYFLHGGTCDFTVLTGSIGVEEKTATPDTEVIVVTPEGGVIGMYTDWVDQSIAQKWTTYHLTQLVPFIDRNLRTIGTKEGRGVVGISMGGLGAMRYASERPDLFAAAASLSGIVDLQHAAFQAGFLVVLQQQGLNPAGPFGDLFNPTWGTANPSNPARAAKLATVQTFIYVGSGSDPVEATVASSGGVLSKALSDNGIPHFFKNYGTPGDTPEGNCNGGHTVACSRYAFADALPRLMTVLADPQ